MRSATEPTSQPPRSRPQQSRSRAKLGRILTATAELLEELSYDDLGTRLIAERAGISIGSLYRFFPDKDGIVQALLLGWLDNFVGILDRAAPGSPCPASCSSSSRSSMHRQFFRRTRLPQRLLPRSAEPQAQGGPAQNDSDLAARLRRLLNPLRPAGRRSGDPLPHRRPGRRLPARRRLSRQPSRRQHGAERGEADALPIPRRVTDGRLPPSPRPER